MARKSISRPIRDSVQSAAPAKPELKLDFEALLTPEERESIRNKARLKIDARDKEEAMDRYLKAEMAKIDAELHPEAEVQMTKFTPQLADYADAIRMEGRVYHHGYEYDVPVTQLPQLMDIEFQTWRHDREITKGSDSGSFYRRSRDMSVNMDNGLATAAGRPVRF